MTNAAGTVHAEKQFYAGSVVTFATQPVTQKAYYGQNVTMQVLAIGGLGTKHYQWYREVGGVPTAVGGDSNTLALASVTAANQGAYYCVVTDQRGPYTSNKGTLTLAAHLTPVISLPATDTATEGQPYTLRVTTAGGHQPVTFEWQVDGVHADATNSYANGSELVLDPAQQSDEAVYTVTILDAHTDSIFQSCTLTVSEPLPAFGLAGLAAVAGALATAGASIVRKRRR